MSPAVVPPLEPGCLALSFTCRSSSSKARTRVFRDFMGGVITCTNWKHRKCNQIKVQQTWQWLETMA